MSYPVYPPPRKPLPATVAIPKAPSRRRNTSLLVTALFVLFFGASITGLALFIPHLKAKRDAQKIDKATLKAADLFLSDMEKARYKSAKRRAFSRSEGWDYAADDLRDTMADVKKRRGKAIGHTGPEWWTIGTADGVPSVRLVYREKYQNGTSAPVVLNMDWRDYQKRWYVAMMDYQ